MPSTGVFGRPHQRDELGLGLLLLFGLDEFTKCHWPRSRNNPGCPWETPGSSLTLPLDMPPRLQAPTTLAHSPARRRTGASGRSARRRCRAAACPCGGRQALWGCRPMAGAVDRPLGAPRWAGTRGVAVGGRSGAARGGERYFGEGELGRCGGLREPRAGRWGTAGPMAAPRRLRPRPQPGPGPDSDPGPDPTRPGPARILTRTRPAPTPPLITECDELRTLRGLFSVRGERGRRHGKRGARGRRATEGSRTRSRGRVRQAPHRRGFGPGPSVQ